MKPVAAGIEANGENEDVTLLREALELCGRDRADQSLLFREPIAPHIAAADEGSPSTCRPSAMRSQRCRRRRRSCSSKASAACSCRWGGFRRCRSGCRAGAAGHPRRRHAARLPEPCAAHPGGAASRGLTLAGWIGNRVDPQMRRFAENLATLERRLPAPFAGRASTRHGSAEAARHLSLPGAPTLRSGPHGVPPEQPRREFSTRTSASFR